MALPLVILAVLALVGGLLNLPGNVFHWTPLGWLRPVFGSALYNPVQSTSTRWVLSIADAVVALVGLAVSLRLWTQRTDIPTLEPAALRKALYIDDIYDAVIGRPSEAFARFCAVVDTQGHRRRRQRGGAPGPHAAARVCAASRPASSVSTRSGSCFGAVILLAYMAARTWA